MGSVYPVRAFILLSGYFRIPTSSHILLKIIALIGFFWLLIPLIVGHGC